MKNEIELSKTYWASVSGGKDSLYMLAHILHNLDKYPLDGVVHFELPHEYPFIKDVVNYMESECKRYNSVWQGNPKYNTEYRRKRIEQMELKEIERW